MIEYRFASYDDFDRVLTLFRKIDRTFPIPLSEKTNLLLLAKKYMENGYLYLAMDDNLPVGMLGFYANDQETHKAYFSVLGVLESYRGQGIAKRILLYSLEFCKNKRMTSCFLYTHKTNAAAIAMYKKLGFVAEEDPNRPHDIKFVKEL